MGSMHPQRETIDVDKVVQALANGTRSDAQIAKTTRLPPHRVLIALNWLGGRRCVVWSPGTEFRLTDNGNDMLKEANAAERARKGSG
jgi:hypothetical protein